jgi:hypothetical protein
MTCPPLVRDHIFEAVERLKKSYPDGFSTYPPCDVKVSADLLVQNWHAGRPVEAHWKLSDMEKLYCEHHLSWMASTYSKVRSHVFEKILRYKELCPEGLCKTNKEVNYVDHTGKNVTWKPKYLIDSISPNWQDVREPKGPWKMTDAEKSFCEEHLLWLLDYVTTTRRIVKRKHSGQEDIRRTRPTPPTKWQNIQEVCRTETVWPLSEFSSGNAENAVEHIAKTMMMSRGTNGNIWFGCKDFGIALTDTKKGCRLPNGIPLLKDKDRFDLIMPETVIDQLGIALHCFAEAIKRSKIPEKHRVSSLSLSNVCRQKEKFVLEYVQKDPYSLQIHDGHDPDDIYAIIRVRIQVLAQFTKPPIVRLYARHLF